MIQIDVRAALILIVTLLLGVALGALGSAALVRHRNAEVRELRRPPGFVAHMEEIIQPRDAAQREQIRAALEATAQANDTIIRGANDRLRAALDSMRARLAPLLDNAQRARLDDFARIKPDFGPPGGGRGPRGGPPPDGPPGDGRGPPPGRGPDGRGPRP